MAEIVSNPVEAVAPVVAETLDASTALKQVIGKARLRGSVSIGLHSATKAIMRTFVENGTLKALEGGARIVILADDCDEASYTKLIKALCAEKKIPLLSVPTGDILGEWCGLCKLDREGKPRKIVSTSVAAITDFGEESKALTFLLNTL